MLLPRTLDRLVDRGTIILPRTLNIGDFEDLMSFISKKLGFRISIKCSREFKTRSSDIDIFGRDTRMEANIHYMESRSYPQEDGSILSKGYRFTNLEYTAGGYYTPRSISRKVPPAIIFYPYLGDPEIKNERIIDVIKENKEDIVIWDNVRNVVIEYFSRNG